MSRKSIAGEFTRGLLSAALILGAATGILWIIQIQQIFNEEAAHLTNREMVVAKNQAKIRVDETADYIRFRENTLISRIEQQVQGRVEEGHKIALSVLERNRTKSPSEIRRMVIESLRAPRFFNGRGYYFIDTLQGDVVLYPTRPEIEGTNALNITDTRGQRVVEQEIKLVKEQGEGYVTGYWPRPNDPDQEGHLKISYVKLLEPFDWYIGTGDYYDDVKAEVRQDIINRYTAFAPDNGTRVFIIDESGNELVPRFKNSGGTTVLPELLRTEEEKQALIKEELEYLASNPAGYAYVRTEKVTSGAEKQSAVYLQAIPKWELIIGAEVPLEATAGAGGWTVSDVKKRALVALTQIAVVIAFIYIVSIYVVRRQSLKMRNDFMAFMSFFKRAAKENVLIDVNDIQIQEFASMANMANQMVEKRQEARDALMASNEQLELQVQNRTKELQESLQILEANQEQLMQNEKLTVLGNLVAGITHEINIPVGIARTLNTDLQELIASVRDGVAGDETRVIELQALLMRMEEDSVMMEANLKRTLELVESFKDVSVDQCSGNRRKFGLKGYLNEIVMSLSPRTRKGGHRVEVICDDEIEVTGYPGVISQIITNLIMNSIQHGFKDRTGGHITIEVIDGGDRVLILYRDDGRGIPARDIGSVYEPFYTTDRERGGTGLGLNIVHQLVTEKLGGSINLTSTEGRGVLFEIEFPRVHGTP